MATTHTPEFKMIVALCRGGGIGFQGTLPWPKLDRDLRFFSEMTRSSIFPYNNAVIMGRKTWESIPEKFRPLPFRDNFILSALHGTTNDAPSPTGATILRNLSEMHSYAKNYDNVWFIGGASIYEQLLSPNGNNGGALLPFSMNNIYITFVDESYEHDTAFPLMYQYESVEEWQKLRNDATNRAIWCWTSADDIPRYVSFFTEGAQSNHLYCITDVDREFVASITRPSDMKAIQERRSPNTIFLSLERILEV